jgi:hypothetical protein
MRAICIFEIWPYSVVSRCEYRDYDVPIRAFQDSDIVADIRKKISCLVWYSKSGDILWQTGAVNLTSHNLKHLLARLFANTFPFTDLLEEPSHILGRRESIWSLALSVELPVSGSAAML